MIELKQHRARSNPKSYPVKRASRHKPRSSGSACTYSEREADACVYVPYAPLSYARLRTWASRTPRLGKGYRGVYPRSLRSRIETFYRTQAQHERLEKLARLVVAIAVQSRSYGYFYFDEMLARLLTWTKATGYARRRLKMGLEMLVQCEALEFQLDYGRKGGLYRIAFYDHGNLEKQEAVVRNFANELKKTLAISSTCQKMRTHTYRAKALGIIANKEEAQALQNIEAKKIRQHARKRLRQAEVRLEAKRRAPAPITHKPPSRAVLLTTQPQAPVSLQKLVTPPQTLVTSKSLRKDRSGGVLGQYRAKLVAMGLTQAVLAYDRLQHARDLR